ncbi:OLC1v1030749C2 [Oldenlandia corymbosa var. corymbosa]|nr:OLC1v1030749C2 [Oldenlandia corymbosa var. corymbosa]
MSGKIAKAADLGNTPVNVKKLDLAWIYPFLALVSFVGLFSIVPLRKVMILKYKLTYPSGTATAYLINSFHTPRGAKLAKKQVAKLFNWFSFSFLFAGFQWFFTGATGDCGFANFPTFGFKAYKQKFFFDFSSTYVGVGMICPYMVNISMLIGAVLSWGVMWPLISKKAGDWYPADLSATSLHGIQGYRIFLAVATMLGDGLYHVVYMLIVTAVSWAQKSSEKDSSVNPDDSSAVAKIKDYDTKRRTEYFLKDQIPVKYAVAGYVSLAVLCMVATPFLFQQRLKWYHVGVSYLIAPVLAFCNAYGCGLTDWSLASNYGKIAILTLSAWVGADDGGVIAGLAACGVMMSIVSTASDLMQDFKTGYLTLASPRTMFFSQVIGTAMGVLISPAVFWFFNTAYSVGDPDGKYPAPFAAMYRGIALLGVEGLSSLPKHCVNLAVICFCAAVALNVIAEILKHVEKTYRIYRFIPSPMCMAIPFYLGGYFTIDMCVGSLILFAWERKNKQKAKEFGPAVASGLICGESLWSVPAAILALVGVNPPMCMKFVPGTAS